MVNPLTILIYEARSRERTEGTRREFPPSPSLSSPITPEAMTKVLLPSVIFGLFRKTGFSSDTWTIGIQAKSDMEPLVSDSLD